MNTIVGSLAVTVLISLMVRLSLPTATLIFVGCLLHAQAWSLWKGE